MSKPSNIFSAVIFLAVLGCGTVFMNFGERTEVSLNEKRELEKMPKFTADSYISGEFASRFDKYYTDTIPMHDKIIEGASFAESLRGISTAPKFYGDVAVIDGQDDSEENEGDLTASLFIYTEYEETETSAESSSDTETTTDTETISDTETTADTSDSITEGTTLSETVSQTELTTFSELLTSETASEAEFNGNINEFLNNGILVNGVQMYGEDAGVMLFGGSKKQGLRYASIINSYKKALGDDVNVYNMIVPTSAEFYLPKKFSKYSASERDSIDYIYNSLSDDVIKVDAYSVLAEHTDEYIYYRTDHHWTGRGAYYAYTAFCDAAGIVPPALEEYEERKIDNFVGSLYGYTGDVTLKNSPDTVYYYMPPAEYSAYAWQGKTLKALGPTAVFHEYASGGNSYGVFIGGDNMHIKVTTKENSGRKLVIFKESYGNALAPYFVNGFDEIYIIDIRNFGANAVKYIRDIGATDVLFVNNAFAANTSTLIGCIEGLFTRK